MLFGFNKFYASFFILAMCLISGEAREKNVQAQVAIYQQDQKVNPLQKEINLQERLKCHLYFLPIPLQHYD